MLIEALKPLRLRLPDREVTLQPKDQFALAVEHVARLLSKAPASVRVIPEPDDWLRAWRELSTVTLGIAPDDLRSEPVMASLDQCDEAYLAGNWGAFQIAAEEVRKRVLCRDRGR